MQGLAFNALFLVAQSSKICWLILASARVGRGERREKGVSQGSWRVGGDQGIPKGRWVRQSLDWQLQ